MTSSAVRPSDPGELPQVHRLLEEAFGPEEGRAIAAVLGDLARRGQLEALLVTIRDAAWRASSD